MAVDVAISRAVVSEELAAMRSLAELYGWIVLPALDQLRATVRMHAHTGDLFIAEISADDYKEIPPLFDFIDPDTGVRGTPHAYPLSHDSFFHRSGPCICAPFNRKAYKGYTSTGPHADWSYGNWMQSSANNFNWSTVTTLGDMLAMIQRRLIQPDLYKGRMG